MLTTIHAINPHDGCYEVVIREGDGPGTEIGTLWGPDEQNGLWVFESNARWDHYIVSPLMDIALLLAHAAYLTEVNK